MLFAPLICRSAPCIISAHHTFDTEDSKQTSLSHPPPSLSCCYHTANVLITFALHCKYSYYNLCNICLHSFKLTFYCCCSLWVLPNKALLHHYNDKVLSMYVICSKYNTAGFCLCQQTGSSGKSAGCWEKRKMLCIIILYLGCQGMIR